MRIALYCNPVAGGWSPLQRDDLGGGEDAIVELSTALQARGHSVVIYGSGYVGDCGAVRYAAYAEAESPDRPEFDVAILRKMPEAIALKLAPRQFLWTDQVRPFDGAGFHRVVVASRYLERCLSSLVPQIGDAVTVIPDGYDRPFMVEVPDRYPVDGTDTKRRRDQALVLHTSSPDRGLLDLLKLWPKVEEESYKRSQDPTWRAPQLLITYGWDLYLKCGGDPRLKDAVDEAMAQCRGVTMARLPKHEVREMYRRAGIWAYYCTGGEFFCQSAIKAQVWGAVPVVRPWGALHETVRSGLRADNPEGFTAALLEALNPARQEELRQGIPTDFLDWPAVAEKWEEVLSITEAPKLSSRITRVPAVPDGLLPKPEESAPNIIGAFIAEWFGQMRIQNPWIHDSAGFALNRPGMQVVSSSTGDGLVLGWMLEEAPDLREALENLAPTPGAFVVASLSFGTWRAKKRHRVLDRRDLLSLFKDMPDFGIRCLPLDSDGNGIMLVGFRWMPEKLGTRDIPAARARLAPRETLSVCFIARNSSPTFLRSLESVAPIADEIIVVDTGSTDDTLGVLERFQKKTGLDVQVHAGFSPRWCWDCGSEHAMGEMAYGHRFAGFETPRNQSVGYARGDHVLWLDTDEQLLEPERLEKYLRPNAFAGCAIAQHHWSIDPPQATKIDNPVRLFRRIADGQPVGLRPEGPHNWPTYHTGATARFAGIVHEHPGGPPTYAEGVAPVILISDVWIAHSGYFTENFRRGRFVRNWPLMVADRMRYPERRLGKFLWIRDLVHHMRYLTERSGGRPTAEAIMLAEEVLDLYRVYFAGQQDPFSQDALGYASDAARLLQRGVDVEVIVKARKPEVLPEEVQLAMSGRFESWELAMEALKARKGELARFEGRYL